MSAKFPLQELIIPMLRVNYLSKSAWAVHQVRARLANILGTSKYVLLNVQQIWPARPNRTLVGNVFAARDLHVRLVNSVFALHCVTALTCIIASVSLRRVNCAGSTWTARMVRFAHAMGLEHARCAMNHAPPAPMELLARFASPHITIRAKI